MAALQCEICGGKLIAKAGGIFECDSCGMQYDKSRVQEMVQEIKGIVTVEGTVEVQGTVQIEGAANAESLLKRGYMRLEDKEWAEADSYFEKVLDSEPENARAYFGKLLATKKLTGGEKLAQLNYDFTADKNWQKAVKFADSAFAEELSAIVTAQKNRIKAEAEADRKARELAKIKLKPMIELLQDPYCPVAITAGRSHVAALKSDGTVVASGENKYGQCEVSDWRDIVAIAAGGYHTVGLKSDGTVVATKYTGEYYAGECEVSDWRDIVAISAGGYHTVGLKSDGTVVATKYTGEYYDGQCEVSDWRDIVAIAAGHTYTVGLKADGTAVSCGDCHAFGGHDTVAIGAPYSIPMYLYADGTVSMDNWRDIVAIAASGFTSAGLKADGTLVVKCDSRSDRPDVSGWKLFNGEADLRAMVERSRAAAEERRIAAEKIENINVIR